MSAIRFTLSASFASMPYMTQDNKACCSCKAATQSMNLDRGHTLPLIFILNAAKGGGCNPCANKNVAVLSTEFQASRPMVGIPSVSCLLKWC